MTQEQTKKLDHQQIMDQAYKKWTDKSWDLSDFINVLDRVEREAVVLGKLNQQVENGGFMQWIDNGYCDAHYYIIQFLLKTVSTRYEKVLKALDLADQAYKNKHSDKILDRLDDEFYHLEPLEQMNEYLQSIQ